MKRFAPFALALAFVVPAAAQPVGIYIEMAVGAKAEDDWSGSIAVSGGRLTSLESRHFPEGMAVTGPDRWSAKARREAVDGFARVNYMEMNPEYHPTPFFSPVGLYATIEPQGSPRVTVRTAQGEFSFAVSELSVDAKPFLDGRVLAALSPAVTRLSSPDYEDDEAAIAAFPNGDIAVAWVGYRDRGDRVFVRTLSGGSWSAAEEVSPASGDFFRCSLVVDANGALHVFWAARDGAKWDIWGRRKSAGSWSAPEKISSLGSNTLHRAAASDDGHVFVVWQSFRGTRGALNSDIFARRYADGRWGEEMRVSESPANDWDPHVAGGPNGAAYFVWDGYDKGDYDIFFRPFEGGRLGAAQQVTTSARYQASAMAAVDPQGRVWVAWHESGTNWGKDQGYLVTPPLATPIHQERTLRFAMWDGKVWTEPKAKIEPFYTYRLFPNMEKPRVVFDGKGTLNVVFRHWTRQNSYGIGSKIMWENFLSRFEGGAWTRPVPLARSAGSIEKGAALVRDRGGEIHAAWMTDERPFEDMVPRNAEIFYAKLGSSPASPDYAATRFAAFEDPFAEAVPNHPNEAENIKTIRDYTIEAGPKRYKIHRGDMHRHSDVSQDYKYDGSLIEIYRYAYDAAGLDYIAPTDHQLGYDQEFTWWQDEKLTDLFHVPGAFVPLFGYERSLNYPNGHRNVVFAKRGTRTLPIGEAERRARTGPILFPYLRANDGISMPHSMGTDQGTDYRDNDPDVEPLVEIFQGYRASYEYEGAPLAASRQKLREQRSGFQAAGYWWQALAKGLKLGVQASSDHWSTHLSYAMILSEDFTRESMFEALKKRHAYGATDNIVLDFQAESGGRRYIMGDIIEGDPRQAPALAIKAIGTDRIKQLVIVKNQKIIYERRPNADSVTIRYTDADFQPGSNYYYVRVVQNNNMVAWSSPIWVE